MNTIFNFIWDWILPIGSIVLIAVILDSMLSD